MGLSGHGKPTFALILPESVGNVFNRSLSCNRARVSRVSRARSRTAGLGQHVA
jgi:hypothetical protein